MQGHTSLNLREPWLTVLGPRWPKTERAPADHVEARLLKPRAMADYAGVLGLKTKRALADHTGEC